jgi:hypothetical protein
VRLAIVFLAVHAKKRPEPPGASHEYAVAIGEESSPRPDGTPKGIRVAAVVGVVLLCLLTAMTLPAFIWLIVGGLCGPRGRLHVTGRGRPTSGGCSGLALRPVRVGRARAPPASPIGDPAIGAERRGNNLLKLGLVSAVGGL